MLISWDGFILTCRIQCNMPSFSPYEDGDEIRELRRFEAAWDSVLKMPYVQGSMREMTDEDIERWGFDSDFATRVPSDDRFEENTRMIGDFIDEESGNTLPIVIERPFRAKQEALEEDKGKRRIFGRGLSHSPYMFGFIPLEHLGMNPNKATWFGREQADPHAVLDGRTVQQIYTPKNYRRRGMASGILDALVEAKRGGYKHGSEVGYLSTAKDSEGRHIHDLRTDEKGREMAHGRPWINTETGAPIWERSPFKISLPSEATKDFVHLMLSRGIYPNEIRPRETIMGDTAFIDANKKWQGEGSLEAREYFDVPSWSGVIGDTEEAKRARGWGLDEEQHYIRPTFGTAFNRAKLYGELRQKMFAELDKASDKCPQNGEPDPITGKIHPYYEDSDFKEPDGCDCWDDWRKAREDFWAAFPEEKSDWWDDEDYDEELTEDDLIPQTSFHLAEKIKDFNRRVDEGEIAPAPEPVWNEEKNAFEYGGKTTQEWLDYERENP